MTARNRDLDTRERIAEFVRDFYRQVAMDDLLGPVFAAAHVDWPAHIAKLTDFWAQQILGEPGYEGNPLRAHQPIHARAPFGPELYERWLDLFTGTVDDFAAGVCAERAKARAEKMARALRLLLDGVHSPGTEPLTVGFRAGGPEHVPREGASSAASSCR